MAKDRFETNCTGIERSSLVVFLCILVTPTILGCNAAWGEYTLANLDTNWQMLLNESGLLIGETHRNPESIGLTRDAVALAIAQYRCMTPALEIPSDQKALLISLVDENAGPESIHLWPQIDFPGYRQFLHYMLRPTQTQSGLHVVTADQPEALEGDRDMAMTQNIRMQLDDGAFVIGLFGSLHIVKGIRYHAFPASRNVADQLAESGYRVKSLVQDW